ncbi:MAG: PHP domain-containing protein [Candidatus Eisenbacteria sp.]|nr:PHP domain-containing protein [Candidatus Eisenbacteria bacterium]
MLRVMAVDLHVHTCLSPCATLDMTPVKIVRKALETKLAMIAVTDHNSAENVAAVMRAARDTDLRVLPGMEVTTSEEAHILALFEEVADALSLQELVYEQLQPGENDEDLFGLQVVANEFDEVEGMNQRLLLGATTLSVEQLVEAIHTQGGLAIAAHIDRDAFSLVGQLGFIPPDLALDAIEISKRLTLPDARARFPEYQNRTFISSSDAHDIGDLAQAPTLIRAAEPAFAELRMALAGLEGRKVLEDSRANHREGRGTAVDG